MTTVDIHEAKTHLSRLLEQVAAGEEIIIAKAGNPIARILPISKPPARKPEIAKGQMTDAFFERLPEDELGAWER